MLDQKARPVQDSRTRGLTVAIAARGLEKSFGSFRALGPVDFTVASGEFVSIVGPSGCGKTTLLRILAGLERPSSGGLSIDGVDMAEVPANRRPVNLVFQDYALFPHLSVFDNVAYGPRGRRDGETTDQIRSRVAEMLRLVEIADKADHRIDQLSGGQRQRVALARAMINRPRVLLLDEPFAALDKALRRDVQHRLQSLQRLLGVVFIMVTHDQHEAMSLSDRVLVMHGGRIAGLGAPRDLYERPPNQFVARFFGDFNLLTPEQARELRMPDGAPPPVRGAAALGFSPDGVRLLATLPDAALCRATLPATVRNVIFAGGYLDVSAVTATGGRISARVPSSSDGARLAIPDAAVLFAVDPARLQIIEPWQQET